MIQFTRHPVVGMLASIAVGISVTSTLAVTNSVYTDPVGFYKLATASGDTIASIPFTREAVSSTLIQSIDQASSNLTISTPLWTPGQFVFSPSTGQSNTYYAFIASGAKEGAYYTIVTNTATTLTLLLETDDLIGISPNDRLLIIPYWTLDTAFPEGRGVHESPAAGDRRTEILIPDTASTGINLSPTLTYFFLSNATTRAWRRVGGGTANRGADVLFPDLYFIIRNNTNAATTFTPIGWVPMKKQRIALATGGTTSQQDNFVAVARPAPQTLNESGLVTSGAFRTSPAAGARTDELLVFDNAAIVNKSPAATYFFLSNATVQAWRKVGGGTVDQGTNEVFTPGTGVIIRKSTNATPTVVQWINSPNY